MTETTAKSGGSGTSTTPVGEEPKKDGAMPGARVNLGWDGASAGAERPAASRPAGTEPSLLVPSSTGDVEVPEPPDFAVVSVIN